MCKFIRAYIGKCNLEPNNNFCKEHAKVICKCGKQAIHECSQINQFVCGKPLCDDCKCQCVWDGYREGLLIELLSFGLYTRTDRFIQENGTELSVVMDFINERKLFLDSILDVYNAKEISGEEKKKKIVDIFRGKDIMISDNEYKKIFGKHSLLKFSQQFINLYYGEKP